MKSKTIATLVVAAGKGTRMRGDVPKQFLRLEGEPIVMHTLRALSEAVEGFSLPRGSRGGNKWRRTRYPYRHHLVVMLPEEYVGWWAEACQEYDFQLPHTVVEGGDARFHTVRNGLEAVPEADWILVHDGVRPMVDKLLVWRVLSAAMEHGAAVPVVPVADSLRQLTDTGNQAANRDTFRAVQTPQGFRADLFRQAYGKGYDPQFTDDASLVEWATDTPITLVDGSLANLKITTREDLELVKIRLRKQK